MDIFFQDPSEVPLPPEEVRIRAFHAEPWPDGLRVHIYLEVDPFQRRPSAELVILNGDGREAASASILEAMNRKMEVTLHLRAAQGPGEYTARAVLYYAAPSSETPSSEGETEAAAGQALPEALPPTIVDSAEVKFSIEE